MLPAYDPAHTSSETQALQVSHLRVYLRKEIYPPATIVIHIQVHQISFLGARDRPKHHTPPPWREVFLKKYAEYSSIQTAARAHWQKEDALLLILIIRLLCEEFFSYYSA